MMTEETEALRELRILEGRVERGFWLKGRVEKRRRERFCGRLSSGRM